MLKRLQDYWPDLLRGAGGGRDEAEQARSDDANGEEDVNDGLYVDEVTITEVYKNIFWTRLIAIEGFHPV